MQFRKAVLKVGTYHSPDGKVSVTPDRLRHWQSEFQRMTSARQVIPIDWDHAAAEADLQPLTMDGYERRRSARTTVGHLKDFQLSPDGNGAELTLDVLDDTAQQKASKNAVYVSPVIFPKWKDGAGNEYQDCITHVDFVNHPVDYSQGKFEPVGSIACALRLGLSAPYQMEGGAMAVRLGSDDPADGFFTKGGKTIPITVGGPEYLDEDHKPAKGTRKRGSKARKGRKGKKMSLRMGDVPPDDEEEKKKPAAPDKPEESDKPESDPTPAADPMIEAADDGGYDRLDEVLDLLEQHFHVALPDDTTDDNLMDRLHTALLTAASHKNGDMEPDEDEQKQPPPGPSGGGDITVADQGAMALALSRMHREQLTTRLQRLLDTGRCTPAEFRAKAESAGAVKLSIDAAGQSKPTNLDQWIESREPVPEGTFWDASRKLQTLSVARPTVNTGELSREEIDAAADWALGRKPTK